MSYFTFIRCVFLIFWRHDIWCIVVFAHLNFINPSCSRSTFFKMKYIISTTAPNIKPNFLAPINGVFVLWLVWREKVGVRIGRLWMCWAVSVILVFVSLLRCRGAVANCFQNTLIRRQRMPPMLHLRKMPSRIGAIPHLSPLR